MTSTVVIGLGNDLRGDDGAGLAAARLLRGRLAPHVRLVENGGDPAELIEAWTGAGLAVVIDAVRSGAPPGTVDLQAGTPAVPAAYGSTHALSLGDAVELGRALGRLPRRLVVCTVEGADFDLGARLSPAVTAALDALIEVVRRQVGDSAGPSE